ncbi:hypothetical protein [Nostoc sp.]|uniref:hypothetical protein n=1 Tax=Nostoc sp. TaxID=1180 RepID=UPI002FFC78E3
MPNRDHLLIDFPKYDRSFNETAIASSTLEKRSLIQLMPKRDRLLTDFPKYDRPLD